MQHCRTNINSHLETIAVTMIHKRSQYSPRSSASSFAKIAVSFQAALLHAYVGIEYAWNRSALSMHTF